MGTSENLAAKHIFWSEVGTAAQEVSLWLSFDTLFDFYHLLLTEVLVRFVSLTREPGSLVSKNFHWCLWACLYSRPNLTPRSFEAGFGFVRKNLRIAGIQFTNHSIEFIVVETNQLLGGNANVIWTRQTCGQRSRRVAGSKRRALAFQVSVRIWYMFWISQWRGKLDVGVCMTSVLAKRMRPRSADFRRILRPNAFLNQKSALCGRILSASTEVMHTPRSDFPLHIDIKNIYQIRTGK